MRFMRCFERPGSGRIVCPTAETGCGSGRVAGRSGACREREQAVSRQQEVCGKVRFLRVPSFVEWSMRRAGNEGFASCVRTVGTGCGSGRVVGCSLFIAHENRRGNGRRRHMVAVGFHGCRARRAEHAPVGKRNGMCRIGCLTKGRQEIVVLGTVQSGGRETWYCYGIRSGIACGRFSAGKKQYFGTPAGAAGNRCCAIAGRRRAVYPAAGYGGRDSSCDSRPRVRIRKGARIADALLAAFRQKWIIPA